MKKIKKFFEKIFMPFISISVLIDESKNANEDGSWDKYLERKNKREENRK